MPQICSVCRHDKHQEIDQALLDQHPLRTIADRWSVSKTALIRHRQDHIPAKLDESTKIAVGVQVNAAPSQNLDLTKLSPEELQQLRALIIKAQPTAAPQVQVTAWKSS